MKISRPLWAQGVFMTPQHFQQQALWERFADEWIARCTSPQPWGVSRVEFDTQALSINRLQLNALSVRLQDGTCIDTQVSDLTPPARDLNTVSPAVDTLIVSIGLPLLDAQGGNCPDADDTPSRPRRYLREYLRVTDLNGSGEEEISVDRRIFELHAGPLGAQRPGAFRDRSGVCAALPVPVGARTADRTHRSPVGNSRQQKREPGGATARALRPDRRFCGGRCVLVLAAA
jgi:hypothetical protein